MLSSPQHFGALCLELPPPLDLASSSSSLQTHASAHTNASARAHAMHPRTQREGERAGGRAAERLGRRGPAAGRAHPPADDAGAGARPAGAYVGGPCPANTYCPAGSAFFAACPASTVAAKGSVDDYDCKVGRRPSGPACRGAGPRLPPRPRRRDSRGPSGLGTLSSASHRGGAWVAGRGSEGRRPQCRRLAAAGLVRDGTEDSREPGRG